MKDFFLWLLKVITLLIVIPVISVSLIMGLITAFGQSAQTLAIEKNTVAVVELLVPIMDAKETVERLYKFAYDESIIGIVLRVDSPGGAVGPSQEIYSAVKTLKERKPIVASMGSVAASGGLYSAVGASKIYAQPGTLTGSIGVIMQFPNFEGASKYLGVKMVTIKSGKLKDAGNPFREIQDYERAYLEGTLDTVHQDFISAISEGRNLPVEEVTKFADGRILTGDTARDLGLIDEFGGIYEAARQVHVLAKKPLGEKELPKLFYPSDRFESFKELLVSFGLAPATLFQNGPRLYFSM